MFFPPGKPAASAPTPELPLLHAEVLDNGLSLRFCAGGNRYFGDYHRVVVDVTITLTFDHPALQDLEPSLLAQGRQRFGAQLVTHKSLERMGVASADVLAVQQELVATFLREAQRYLSRADYPGKLLRSELERQPSRRLLPKLK